MKGADVGALFFNGRSVLGWGRTLAGALIILVGIVANFGVYFRPTTLFDTLVMLGLVGGGIGLVARSGEGDARPRARAAAPDLARLPFSLPTHR